MVAGTSRSRRVRIVHCIESMVVGGTQTQLAALICGLPRDRFEQALVLVRGGGALLDRVRSTDCRIVELGFGSAGRLGLRGRIGVLGAIAAYRRELLSFQPDIVSGQLSWSNLLSVVAARLAHVPNVVTSRRALASRDRITQRKWMVRATHLANRWTTAIAVNSEAVRRDLIESERVPSEIVSVIPNGVVHDQAELQDRGAARQALGLTGGDLVLVVVANLHPYKGHVDVVRALALLNLRHPNLRLLLPGADQGMKAPLEALTRELKLERQVRMLGVRHDIPRLLAAADIVVHPSYGEGFSNAIIEAMYSGRPVVATDVGGNPEAVRDGLDGLLVPPHSPEALAAAIDRLATHADLRLRMGESGRARVASEFSLDRMIGRFAAYYESLAATRPRRG